jgi:hypothetical protein
MIVDDQDPALSLLILVDNNFAAGNIAVKSAV